MTSNFRSVVPRTAMVLAAGNGMRMRPLTDRTPKPLIRVGGKPLLDNVLDRLAAAGVETAVVNVHHLADQIERHVAGRRAPRIVISDERASLLDTGGGVVKALPQARRGAVLSSQLRHHLDRRREDPTWSASPKASTPHGWMRCSCWRRPPAASAIPAAATSPWRRTAGCGGGRARGRAVRLCRRRDPVAGPVRRRARGPFSLDLFDRAIEAGRFYGLRLEGVWMHVGTPEAIAAAEAAILASAA